MRCVKVKSTDKGQDRKMKKVGAGDGETGRVVVLKMVYKETLVGSESWLRGETWG